MEYHKTTVKPFSAQITLGLEKGYTQEVIQKKQILQFIQTYQKELFINKNIAISASVSHCDIVFSGQIEPHLKLNFINYPKFPLEEKHLKETINNLTKALMQEFLQNRVVVEYLDETVMFEITNEIDPRIN
ncbi:hypothetical protein [Polaribacter sp. MED152]|uniref:hypothetical protein n=1 Tax=Polaribacter sp. MED152 TaxID=313598 RepID=UPI000068CB73|nr:hypothetical protein [Polaribacter sp. MED152]EAQ42514.1 hypothetical protein MED152_07330 [Polaribacter sp. MED152]